jgi:hypothetical protein
MKINMVAWLKYKWIIKEKLVIIFKLNARIYVGIERGYKDEYRFDGPQLEACTPVVNQEHTYEAVFQMKINCGW